MNLKEIQQYMKNKQAEMLELLELLVNVDSGTGFCNGINQVGEILARKWRKLGFDIQKNGSPNGDNLLCYTEKESEPRILLVGHMDTVFSPGTVEKRPFQICNKKAKGPGVIDMKSGLVSMLYAVKALSALEVDVTPNIVVILNVDEETGSPTSRKLIETTASDSDYALIFEPARANGAVVTRRKGVAQFELNIKGIAAHAANPEEGVDATHETAHKIISLYELSEMENDITINVGVVCAGERINVIAERAEIKVDTRFSHPKEKKIIEEKMVEVTDNSFIEGTKCQLKCIHRRDPMILDEKAKQLLQIVKREANKLSLSLPTASTGGFSDGNLTSGVGTPTIDGMGPVGGKPHSLEEYLEIDSITERVSLAALVIKSLISSANGNITFC